MGQKQELKDQKPESSVEHEIKSSVTVTTEIAQMEATRWEPTMAHGVHCCLSCRHFTHTIHHQYKELRN
jgi:hypothetical protein